MSRMRLYILSIIFVSFAAIVFAGGAHMKSARNTLFAVTTTGTSLLADSTHDTTTVSIIDRMYNYGSVTGMVIVGAADSTSHGYGLADSAKITIQSTLGPTVFDISSTSFAAIPCTLFYSSPPDLGKSDTLFKSDMQIRVIVVDTLADFAMTATYPITWDFVFQSK